MKKYFKNVSYTTVIAMSISSTSIWFLVELVRSLILVPCRVGLVVSVSSSHTVVSDLPTATHIAYPVRYFGCEYADTLIRMNYTQNHNFVYKF